MNLEHLVCLVGLVDQADQADQVVQGDLDLEAVLQYQECPHPEIMYM